MQKLMPSARVTFHSQLHWVGRGWGKRSLAQAGPRVQLWACLHLWQVHALSSVSALQAATWALWVGVAVQGPLEPPQPSWSHCGLRSLGLCSGRTRTWSMFAHLPDQDVFLLGSRFKCSDAFSGPLTTPLPSMPSSSCPSSNTQQKSSLCDLASVCPTQL